MKAFLFILCVLSSSASAKATDEILEQKMLDLRSAVVHFTENPSSTTAEIEARLRSLQKASGIALPIETLTERAKAGDLEISPEDGALKYHRVTDAQIIILPVIYVQSSTTRKIPNKPTGTVIPFPEPATVK